MEKEGNCYAKKIKKEWRSLLEFEFDFIGGFFRAQNEHPSFPGRGVQLCFLLFLELQQAA
jgi:hypothetical protein